TTPLTVWADDVYSWSEGDEQVFLVGGSVLIQQDQTSIWTNRAVIWVDSEAYKKHKPIRVTIYADENKGKVVGIETKGSPRQEAAAAVVEFTTPRFGWVRGRERQESLAHSPFYKLALAARGKPTPSTKNEPSTDTPPIKPVQFVQPDPIPPKAAPKGGDPKAP